MNTMERQSIGQSNRNNIDIDVGQLDGMGGETNKAQKMVTFLNMFQKSNDGVNNQSRNNIGGGESGLSQDMSHAFSSQDKTEVIIED